jgi:hypothetical protein
MSRIKPPRVNIELILKNPNDFDRGLFAATAKIKALLVESKQCHSLCKALKTVLLKLGNARTVVDDEGESKMKRVLFSPAITGPSVLSEPQQATVTRSNAQVSALAYVQLRS